MNRIDEQNSREEVEELLGNLSPSGSTTTFFGLMLLAGILVGIAFAMSQFLP